MWVLSPGRDKVLNTGTYCSLHDAHHECYAQGVHFTRLKYHVTGWRIMTGAFGMVYRRGSTIKSAPGPLSHKETSFIKPEHTKKNSSKGTHIYTATRKNIKCVLH